MRAENRSGQAGRLLLKSAHSRRMRRPRTSRRTRDARPTSTGTVTRRRMPGRRRSRFTRLQSTPPRTRQDGGSPHEIADRRDRPGGSLAAAAASHRPRRRPPPPGRAGCRRCPRPRRPMPGRPATADRRTDAADPNVRDVGPARADPPDQTQPLAIALPDDPIEPYLLTKENGPFMVHGQDLPRTRLRADGAGAGARSCATSTVCRPTSSAPRTSP